MSLAPKIDEVRHSVSQSKVDLANFTETWLSDSVGDNVIQIPGNNKVQSINMVGLFVRQKLDFL